MEDHVVALAVIGFIRKRKNFLPPPNQVQVKVSQGHTWPTHWLSSLGAKEQEVNARVINSKKIKIYSLV